MAGNVSADERYAAEMIADELGQKTCGGAMPVLNATHATMLTSNVIAVGAGAFALLQKAAALSLPPLSADTLGDEGYVLAGSGKDKWAALSGRPGSPRGSSYAAVEWLEEIGLKFLGESTFSKPSLTLILGLTRAGALASVGLHDLPELP